MDFEIVEARVTGVTEHDKFSREIARKNGELKLIYDEVKSALDKMKEYGGYEQIDNMKSELNNVRAELVLMSREMKTAMDSLISE